jgi:hypothetical protein
MECAAVGLRQESMPLTTYPSGGAHEKPLEASAL